jgi:O-6-methylguanine DNA methyltransferase
VVEIAAVQEAEWWFGIAHEDDELVATASGSTQEEALRRVRRSVPHGIEYEEEPDPGIFAAAAAKMLAELEDGQEANKRFTLSTTRLDRGLRNILYTAASIPIGYVSSYGEIAKAAGAEARAVGRVMATNPLYPIVPCHRVVGSSMRLVGYGGRQDEDALNAKLSRLRSEAQGYPEARNVATPSGTLAIYPVEWVIAADHAGINRQKGTVDKDQLSLFD